MANRKNILWIMADQMRGSAMGCGGDANARTPHLDNLADTGVRFTHAVSGYPLCCPFRGSLITGRYPHNSSVNGHDIPLDPEMPTIADLFNQEGYQTTYIGKWHLNGPEDPALKSPLNITAKKRRGRFKKWIGYGNNNSQWDCHVHGHDGEEEIPLRYLSGYETDALTDLTITELKKHGQMKREGCEEPFFMVLSVQPPHNPYVAPAVNRSHFRPQELVLRPNVPAAETSAGSETRRLLAGYYAAIENLDDNVGRLWQTLEEEELRFDTHILFFSDHGDMMGSHGMMHKTNPYEEAIRIPLIISGETPMAYDGRKCGVTDAVVNHVDITATTLGLCGLDIPSWVEGYDYSHYRLAASEKKEEEPTEAYLQNTLPTGHRHSTDKPYRGIVTRDGWKYVCFSGMEWLLFDLCRDPYEERNLAHEPTFLWKKKELNRRLGQWIDKTGDHFTLPSFPEY